MIFVREVDTNNFESATVQLRLSAQVRDEQCVDDCAAVILKRGEVIVRYPLRDHTEAATMETAVVSCQ